MKLCLLRSGTGAARRRAALALSSVLVTFALSAAAASSASAFAWWVGTPGEPHMLAEGAKLPINSGGTVHSSFTLKWRHIYEVRCGAVKYNEMFLEGPVFLGAHSIEFEECAPKKPKHATLIGGRIDTVPVYGEIKPVGGQVEFSFEPAGGTLASFEIERTVKPKHKTKKSHDRQCTYAVTAIGPLTGDLGDATTISTEKTYEFDSTHLTLKQHKTCVEPPPAARRAGRNVAPPGAPGLVLKTAAGRLGSGAPLKLHSSNMTMAMEFGKTPDQVQCATNKLEGTLEGNGAKTDKASLTSAIATGPGGSPCASTLPALGPVTVSETGLPWAVSFTSSGLLLQKGTPGVEISLDFEGAGLVCNLEAVELTSAITTSGPVTVTTTNQQFGQVKGGGSSPGCPTELRLNATYALTSSGEVVEAEIPEGAKEAKEKQAEEEERTEEAAEEIEEAEAQPVEGNKGTLGYSATEGWGVL